MVTRGCGDHRIEGGLYISIPTSSLGFPLEHFLIDSAIQWDGGTLRSPKIVTDPAGTNHIILGIGREHYPSFTDFFYETRAHGLSKRVPRGFDPSRLEFGKSKFLLTHPHAIPRRPFKADYVCPKTAAGEPLHKPRDPRCVGGLWPLAGIEPSTKKHEVLPDGGAGEFTIKTPSVEYRVPICREPDSMTYDAGVLLQFSLFRFEFVNKAKQLPADLKERFEGKGWDIKAVPE